MKTAIVTGGTKGIGKSIVVELLKQDYFVWTNYANDDKAAEDASKDFQKISSHYKIIKADQSQKKSFPTHSSFVFASKVYPPYCFNIEYSDSKNIFVQSHAVLSKELFLQSHIRVHKYIPGWGNCYHCFVSTISVSRKHLHHRKETLEIICTFLLYKAGKSLTRWASAHISEKR